MGDVTICWAPECAGLITQTGRGRPQRYCNVNCKMKSVRRNGGKAPKEPYPPLVPDAHPLHQDATSATVVSGSEQSRKATEARKGLVPGGGRSDVEVLGQPRPTRRGRKRAGNVTPPAVATAGKAPASVRKQPAPAGAVPPGEGPAVRFPAAGPDSPEATVTPLHPSSATLPEPAWKPHPMVAQYQADLQRMGIDQTRQGLQVLAMAEKLVSSATSASAASTLSRELDRMMTELEQKTPEAQALLDPSAVIRERTLAKLRAAAAEMTG